MVGGATSGPSIRAAWRMVVPSGTSMVWPSMVTFINSKVLIQKSKVCGQFKEIGWYKVISKQ
jgi:hypothetical protein